MREFLNAKTVVIADPVLQTEIAFEAEADQTDTPDAQADAESVANLSRRPYDSRQFSQAFRTALEETE